MVDQPENIQDVLGNTKKPTVLASITISGMSDGKVAVTGNIPAELDTALDLIHTAVKIIAKHFAMAAQSGDAKIGPPRIVVPKGPIVGLN